MNNQTFAPSIKRRTQLQTLVKEVYPDQKGAIVLFASFEQVRTAFLQESTFYYFTGLNEPGCALVIDSDGEVTLWVPHYGTARSQWASTIVESDSKGAAQWGINAIRHLGHPCKGYTTSLRCTVQENEHLLTYLEGLVKKGQVIFTPYSATALTDYNLLIDRLFTQKSFLKEALVDISPLIGSLRRTKSQFELEEIYEAIDCTMQAQEAAAGRIAPDIYEYQLQAAIEFIFKESGNGPAYPTIVGSGINSTVLHYTDNNGLLKKGDLVLIDCGALINHYCADLTRTYPVSGTFTDRQREVYDIVLETQDYIADLAKPGYWLSNPQYKEISLHHLAIEFLETKGYAEYFPHGIGHFLGLDVHDVGSDLGPLKEGDVITIEPGIYIPKERIGIRIEDNYWITSSGAVCMSEELPRDSYEIEEFMKGEFEEDEE